MTRKDDARSIVEISVLGFFFVCLALLGVSFRDAEVLELISAGKAVSTSHYSGWGASTATCRVASGSATPGWEWRWNRP